MSGRYHPTFFSEVAPGSAASAHRIVPLLLGLTDIGSVVDVGCGAGGWLATFAELGVDDYLGIDGSYVDAASLPFPSDRFRAHDLEDPIVLDRRFDLALSLEVAEHLGADRAAAHVVSLTGLAPIVAFSAAIPGQGGVGHVNEQWPDYWEALFAARGYVLLDWFRPQLWDDDAIEPWYRQNLFLFVERDRLDHLREAVDGDRPLPLRLVHPDVFKMVLSEPLSLRAIAKAAPPAVRASVGARWARRPGWLASPRTADPARSAGPAA
ncbi:MAG: class I SAM-dependent methyltransferase [Actinomycetota bacterium]|nr:class I SAM-dependent methyltransferase [Actinomycetota bacterium]